MIFFIHHSRFNRFNYYISRNDLLHQNQKKRIQKKKKTTFDFSRFSKILRSSKLILNTSLNMSITAEKLLNFFNLTKKNIQIVVMLMFIIFIQNAVVKINILIQNVSSKNYFKITNVNFFDFKFEKSYNSDDVVQINRNVYHRNIFIFVKKIKNVIITYKIKTIKINFLISLRETIQIWYIKNLNNLKKQTFRFFNEKTDHWCEIFIKKFWQWIIFVFQKFLNEKYFLNDVKNYTHILNFVFSIIKYAKTININDQYS